MHRTANTGRYKHTNIALSASKAVTFSVQARNDAHVGFFSAKKSLKEVYEIVIGGWGNRQSVIRQSNQGRNEVTKATPGIVSGSKARRFWADAKGGLVRLGRGSKVGARIIMQWKDKNPHVVSSIGVMTGWGATGNWKVCTHSPLPPSANAGECAAGPPKTITGTGALAEGSGSGSGMKGIAL